MTASSSRGTLRTVSVIVRAFNEAKHIRRCLEGVLSQETPFAVEAVLVDSGSNDGTREIAESMGVQVVNIDPDEFSFGRSLNYGIERAQGEICVMISAHCYPVGNQWLEKLVAPFEDRAVALSYGKQRGNSVTKFSEQRIFIRWFPDTSTARQTHSFCNNANAAIRRSLWRARKFDESLTGMEDIDWAEHALRRGYVLSYVADACVIHVHEETHSGIFRRYEREALAIKAIYRQAKFSLWDFIHLVVLNTLGDYAAALRQRVFLRNLRAIPIFRVLQFWGTYRAHKVRAPFDKRLRYQLYYPPGFGRAARHAAASNVHASAPSHPVLFDITLPLDEKLAVWPGSRPFSIEWVKRFDSHGVNETHLSLNTHTGTHMDAPFHFVDGGKRVDETDLEKLIGTAYVVEIPGGGPVDAQLLEQAAIPGKCRRLLLKTRNSAVPRTGGFNADFAALTPDAARWIVKRRIDLIGVDGYSVQQYSEKSNETHRTLLGADVVILEGLNLTAVPPGTYHLLALPLNITGAEGAPVRAILSTEPLAPGFLTSMDVQ